MAKKLYAYGVVEDGERRVFDHAYTIPFRDIALVVSEVPGQVWKPSQENLMRHQEVVSRVARECTILPMSFGIIIPKEEQVQQMLESEYEELKQNFAKVRGRIELGLKVLWQKEALVAELERDYEHLGKLKAEIQAMPPEEAYQHAIRLGQMVERAINEKRTIYEDLIFAPLAELAVEAHLNDPIGERMVFNAAFLLDKSAEDEFDRQINEQYEKYQHLFLFKYSGPWPPYNFVDLHLQLDVRE